jgi:hypothetical protein
MVQRSDNLRRQLAIEAARVMAEQGVKDFLTAKKKAAEKYGVQNGVNMPKNSEIEQALIEHQRIFQSSSQPQQLKKLREAAVESLTFFDAFRPRLVGSVLRGTAGPHSDVNLHVFTSPEGFIHFLRQHDIPVEQKQRRYKFGKNKDGSIKEKDIPVFQFMAGDVPFDIAVFDESAGRDVPLSKVDGRPEERASLFVLQELIKNI